MVKPNQHVKPLYGKKSYIYLGGMIVFQCWSNLQEPTTKVVGICICLYPVAVMPMAKLIIFEKINVELQIKQVKF